MSFKKIFNQAILITILSATIISSCSKEEISKEIIPQNQMIDALVDIHIAESLYSQRYSVKLNYKNASNDLYNSVLTKHNLSDSIFATSIIYYSKNPELYATMYEKVMDKLNMMEVEIKERQDEKRKKIQEERDLKNNRMKNHPDSISAKKVKPIKK